MTPNRDLLRTQSTALSPLTGSENVLSIAQGSQVGLEYPVSLTYSTFPNTLSPPTPAPTPQPLMPERRTSSGSSTATTIAKSSPTSPDLITEAMAWSSLAPTYLCNLPSAAIDSLLMSTLSHLSSSQLMHLSSILPARLKRDFLTDLPPEIALSILSFVDDVKTLARASRVSRTWRVLVNDDAPWKALCARRGFEVDEVDEHSSPHEVQQRNRRLTADTPGPLATVRNLWAESSQAEGYDADKGDESARILNQPSKQPSIIRPTFSYRKHFKIAYTTEANWRHSGRLLRSHRSQDAGVVTSLAMDGQWIVVGLASSRVHVFSASTGVLARTLIGHEAGVWSLWLVSKCGSLNRTKAEPRNAPIIDNEILSVPQEDDSKLPVSLQTGIGAGPTSPTLSLSESSTSSSSSSDMPFQSVFDGLRPPPAESRDIPAENGNPSAQQSDPCNASHGWGQANALVISGGCDKQIRVWDVKSGYCLYVLRGHRSTVRCIKMFHGRPVAVSGGRDHTLRVWDIQRGILLRTLEGHTDSVRCLDVFGDQVVSGSYDCTVRLWNVDTGECLRVFNGHYHQVYTVAFDGERIASGGLDTTVRIWSASTGACLALLQGHTALVCQLQLSSRTDMVVTGSADGRIIVFGIAPATSQAPTANHSFPIAARLESDVPASPPLSPYMAAMKTRNEHDAAGRDVSGYKILARVPAHSSGVTGLQFDNRPGRQRVVSGGNDGRVQLWEFTTVSNSNHGVQTYNDSNRSHSWRGEMRLVRDLTEPCEGLWKVAFRGDQAVICCLRSGRTVLEIWSFRPVEEDL